MLLRQKLIRHSAKGREIELAWGSVTLLKASFGQDYPENKKAPDPGPGIMS